MANRKVYPALTDFTGGLATALNPLSRLPNQWSNANNVVVCKPYGFKTQTPEQEHIAQTRPPMRTFLTGSFDVSIAGTPTEVKPLVGATQAAADDAPTEWQSLALGISAEGWTAGGTYTGVGSVANTLSDQSPGLTQSDTNNSQLALLSAGINSGTDTSYNLVVTLTNPYTQGLIGNNATMLYIDYTELYQSQATGAPSAVGAITALTLRIGTSSSSYLTYTLPVGSIASPPTNTFTVATNAYTLSYGKYRYSVNLRDFTSLVGSNDTGVILNNLVYFALFVTTNPSPGSDYSFYSNNTTQANIITVDNIRLDVDYLGFFGDFTVVQPYQSVTIHDLDPNSEIFPGTWVYANGAYPERRLSIGNGCIAFEIDTGSTTGSATFTFDNPINLSTHPTYVLLDYLIQNHVNLPVHNGIEIIFGSSASNYYYYLFNPNTDGNAMFYELLSNFGTTGTPNLAAISYIKITVTTGSGASGEPNALRAYFSNLRFAPYTNNPGFPAQSGNIRDSYLYDPTDVGQSTRFLLSCGDGLFLGSSFLSGQSWYVGGGFTNWNAVSPQDGFLSRFQFTTAPNPDFIFSTELQSGSSTLNGSASAGATSVVVNAASNIVQGMQIIIGGGVYTVASTYSNNSTTVPLTSALTQNYSSGTFVAWGGGLLGNQSITVGGAVNLNPGAQVVIDPDGVNPEMNYVASSYTGGINIPLQTALQFSHASGAEVTWENTAEPKTIALFVNGSDGYWMAKVISYPLSAGGVYQYPVVEKLYPEAYSTIVSHGGTVMLAGDPNNPNRIVVTDPSDATSIPAESFVELDTSGNVAAGDSITCLRSKEKFLIAFRRTGAFVMYGDSINNYEVEPTSCQRGAIGPALVTDAGRRLFFASHDGIYEFVNFEAKPISDNIKNLFQNDNQDIMASSFLAYNPLREMLILGFNVNYNLDPVEGYVTNIAYTYSLEKSAWGIMSSYFSNGTWQVNVDPRYTPFSAIYYGGGTNPPTFYMSSTVMLEMDNGPDTQQDVVILETTNNYFGQPAQTKTIDILYFFTGGSSVPISNFTNSKGTFYASLGMNGSLTGLVSALFSGQFGVNDGVCETIIPGGCMGKSAGFYLQGAFNEWATAPILFQGFSVSYYPMEDL